MQNKQPNSVIQIVQKKHIDFSLWNIHKSSFYGVIFDTLHVHMYIQTWETFYDAQVIKKRDNFDMIMVQKYYTVLKIL